MTLGLGPNVALLLRHPDCAACPAAAREGGAEAMEKSITTLIVDDSEQSRDWLRHKLAGLGCVVVGEAENAAEGLERFEALHPRLVTLDIMMPNIGGMTAIDLLRRISRENAEVAVIVVSVRPLADSHDFLKLGAIGYLEKPFIDFEAAAKLLKAYFPELEKSAALRKRGGISSRLVHKS
jgi:two-component system chemotaxis response regulator CheY